MLWFTFQSPEKDILVCPLVGEPAIGLPPFPCHTFTYLFENQLGREGGMCEEGCGDTEEDKKKDT